MGVLNLTPDSFSDGGRFAGAAGAFRPAARAVVEAGRRMADEGAAVLDLGAVSTRPGAGPVAPEEEWARLEPALGALRGALALPISLDTSSAFVLRRALGVGVDLLNDVSALGDDPEMAGAAADSGVPVVLMHRRGTPRTMQLAPRYDDAPREVGAELLAAVTRAEAAGIERGRILLDPGLGFGKRLEDNLALLAALPQFAALGHRTVVGASRKSFLGALTGAPVTAREHATTATTVLAGLAGVDFVRVHDVGAAVQALAVVSAVAASSRRAAPAAPPVPPGDVRRHG